MHLEESPAPLVSHLLSSSSSLMLRAALLASSSPFFHRPVLTPPHPPPPQPLLHPRSWVQECNEYLHSAAVKVLTNGKVSAGTVSLRVCLRDLSDFTRDLEYCRHRQRGGMCGTLCVCVCSPVLGERSEVGDLECVGVGLVVLVEDDSPRTLLPILHYLLKTEGCRVSAVFFYWSPSA